MLGLKEQLLRRVLMASTRVTGSGMAIRLLSFVEEIGPDGRYVITVCDDKGNPECNGFGATREDAIGDIYKKGYQIVLDHFVKGDRIIWRTKRV
jgi:hypothetical protein